MSGTPASDLEIVYKLGAIESQVNSLGEEVRKSFERLEKKIDDTAKENKETTEKLSERVTKLEEWQNRINVRVTSAIAAISFFWVVVGKSVSDFVSGLFH